MENFVHVGTYPDAMQAQLAQATLAAAEIESYLSSDDVGGMLPPLDRAGGVRLFVDKKNEEEALALLNTQSTPLAE